MGKLNTLINNTTEFEERVKDKFEIFDHSKCIKNGECEYNICRTGSYMPIEYSSEDYATLTPTSHCWFDMLRAETAVRNEIQKETKDTADREREIRRNAAISRLKKRSGCGDRVIRMKNKITNATRSVFNTLFVYPYKYFFDYENTFAGKVFEFKYGSIAFRRNLDE
jgi:hypothetical protein